MNFGRFARRPCGLHRPGGSRPAWSLKEVIENSGKNWTGILDFFRQIGKKTVRGAAARGGAFALSDRGLTGRDVDGEGATKWLWGGPHLSPNQGGPTPTATHS